MRRQAANKIVLSIVRSYKETERETKTTQSSPSN